MTDYTVTGNVVNRQTGAGEADLLVEGWNRVPDPQPLENRVAYGTTEADGRFHLEFNSDDFSDHPAGDSPDIYFKVWRGPTLLANTEGGIGWYAERPHEEVLIEVDLPVNDNDAEPPFVARGQISYEDGSPAAGVAVRALDRDLRREEPLGQTQSDRAGHYEIRYGPADFARAEKRSADLLVRVFSDEGIRLGESGTLFNAGPEAEINVTVSRPTPRELTRYETLRALLDPMLSSEGVGRAELTENDMDFLVREFADEEIVAPRDLEYLSQGARLSQETALPDTFFYGVAFVRDLARPLELNAFLEMPDEEIRQAVKEAVHTLIVPESLLEGIEDILSRLEALRFEEGHLVRRRVTGRLLDEANGEPVVGYRVQAFDLDEGENDLGFDLSDAEGLFVLFFVTPAGDDAPRHLRLHVADPEGEEIYQTEIEAPPDQEEPIDNTIPVPEAPDPAAIGWQTLEEAAGFTAPPELVTFLADHDIHTLLDIRHAGGLRRLEGLPLPEDDPAVRTLEAHANLTVLSPDVTRNQKLIEHGFPTIYEIASVTRPDFVRAVGDDVGDFRAAEFYVKARSQTFLLGQILTNIQVDWNGGGGGQNGLADHLRKMIDPDLMRDWFPERCSCPDCEAAVSPLAYLADLLNYARKNMKYNGLPINVAWLEHRLHQPFGRLPTACDAVDEKVRQVRLCIEVLRSYLEAHQLPSGEAAKVLKSAEEKYRMAVYTDLLTRLGTSYEEIRLAQHADEETRQALADRLGLDLDPNQPDPLAELYMVPAPMPVPAPVLSEAALEALFGLVDTSRDPLADGPQPKLWRWKSDHLRTLWREQDRPTTPYSAWADERLPIIDPDLIGPDDLRQPIAGQPAFDLWLDRRQKVDGVQSSLKSKREQDGLPAVLGVVWGTPLPDLAGLLEALLNGSKKEAEAAQEKIKQILSLTASSFIRLMEIKAKHDEGEEVAESEWREVDNILTQVKKVKELFDQWLIDEESPLNSIILGPQQFWLPLREPFIGEWPPQDLERPLIDPEVLSLEDLPETTAGAAAIKLWQDRRDQLADINKDLKSERENHGVTDMLELALGEPNPGDPLPHNLADLQKALASSDPTLVADAEQKIEKGLYMKVEEFRRMMAILSKADQPNPADQPSKQEWAAVYAILTTAHKKKHIYPGWKIHEENASNSVADYWQALKARLPLWRASVEARQAWQQALRQRSDRPLIDPDLIGPIDLESPTSGPAYELWQTRRDSIDQTVLPPLQAEPQTLAGFEKIVGQSLGLPVAMLSELVTQRDEGHDISDRLAQLSLTTAAFNRLMELHALLVDGTPALALEWQDVYNILVQVAKQREYAAWQDAEEEKKLVLGPDDFAVPADQVANDDKALPTWQATWRERRDWQDRLQSRIDQEAEVIEACQSVVGDTEEATLPMLRDALLLALDQGGPQLEDKADWVTDNLLIDAQTGGCQTTTRVSQAIETIQQLIWGAKTGQLGASLEALSLEAYNFDEEWRWIGSYANWRSAMFIFMYPENTLHPNLRKRKTPAFNRLVASLNDRAEVTPKNACEAAQDYADYFEDVAKLSPEATVLARTRYREGDCRQARTTRERHLVYAFARNTRQEGANRVYFAVYNPYQIHRIASQGDTFQIHRTESPEDTFWTPVPTLENVIEIVGAVAYAISPTDRYIYLFARVPKLDKEELVYTRFDLEDSEINPPNYGWKGRLPVKLPGDNVTQFTAVVKQRHDEEDPPHVTVRLPGGEIYARQMAGDGENWEESGDYKGWNLLVGPPKGVQFSKLGAMIEPASNESTHDEFLLFMEVPRYSGDQFYSHVFYRLFGPRDDDYWQPLKHAIASFPYYRALSWVGGFNWPKTEDVSVFWKAKDLSDETYSQLLRCSKTMVTPQPEIVIPDIQGETVEQKLKGLKQETIVDRFDKWLQEVTGFSLAYPRIHSGALPDNEYNLTYVGYWGMSYLDFLRLLPPDDLTQIYVEWRNPQARMLDHLIPAIEDAQQNDPEIQWVNQATMKFFKYSFSDILQSLLRKHQDQVFKAINGVGLLETGPALEAQKRSLTYTKRDTANELNNFSTTIYKPERLVFPSGFPPTNVATTCGLGQFPPSKPAISRLRLTRQPDDQLKESQPVLMSPQVRMSLGIFQWSLPEALFDIVQSLSNAELEARQAKMLTPFLFNSTPPATVLTYLAEAWYFVPVYLALQLQRHQHYTEALDWLRIVYNYAEADPNRRKIYPGLVLEESLASNFNRASNWLLDSPNPHGVAVTRRNCYTRYTLFTLVRCLLAYADDEFTADTAETLARARTLYLTALDLLDDLPAVSNHCQEILIDLDLEIPDPHWAPMLDALRKGLGLLGDSLTVKKTTEAVKEALALDGSWATRFEVANNLIEDAVANQPPPPPISTVIDMKDTAALAVHRALLYDPTVATLADTVGNQAAVDFGQAFGATTGDQARDGGEIPWLRHAVTEGDAVNLFGSIIESSALPPGLDPPPIPFCIPANPVIEALRSHAKLNLYKLRNCLNIAGMRREVEPYAAPTDTTTGLPFSWESGQLPLPGVRSIQPTIYRYPALIERAKQLVQLASQMENAMLVALEKKESEAYSRLRARQEMDLAQAQVQLQGLRVTEAQGNVGLAMLQQQRARIQFDHFRNLLGQGLLWQERASLKLLEGVAANQLAAAVATYIRTGLPSFLSVFSSGGENLKALAKANEYMAASMETEAKTLETRASYERRRQDWELQKNLANQDTAIGAQQVQIATDHVSVVQQEQSISRLQATHARDTMNFLMNKFLNEELYEWMSNVLEGIYRYFLQQATAMAKLAENQLAFERQKTPPTYIQADYWAVPTPTTLMSSGDDGTTDRRGLTGSARLLQDIYKLDQYAFTTDERKLQLTKTISLARLAPVEFQRFRETGVMNFATPMEMFDRDFPGHYLRLIKRVRTSVIALIPPTEGIRATLSTVGISRTVTGGDGLFHVAPVKRLPESVALTSSMNATGLFELTPQTPQEMLLPFEGMGVDTSWELRMPKPSNPFDYSTIADVLLTIEYTALNDSTYRQQVIRQLDTRFSAERPFSFRNEFADPWYDLHNPELTATPMVVRFRTRRQDFPPNVEDLKIQHVVLYFARQDETKFEIPVTHLRFTEHGGVGTVGGGANSIDGIISTRRGNAGGWMAMLGKSPIGDWELALPDKPEMRNRFKDEEIEDMLFVITYRGRTPKWPA